MGGSSWVPVLGGGQVGAYGTLGTPASGNVPGGRDGASSWIDANGNFWLFGGAGFDASGNFGWLNDLWEFNPSTKEWAWMGGSSTVGSDCESLGGGLSICGQSGVYGTLGIPAAGNVPGGRNSALSWTNSSGNFWLLGGNGLYANGEQGEHNDLWEFNPSTNLWAWMGGSDTVPSSCALLNGSSFCGQPGVYGTLGTPATGNNPGGRGSASSWTDSAGHLWLFGGIGFDAADNSGRLNDFWEYLPKATPTVSVTSSASSITTAQPLRVTVAVSGTPIPTGSVTLTGGGYTNTQTLSGGGSTFTIAAGSLGAGHVTFTANYSPDPIGSSIYSSATGISATVTVTTPTFTVSGTSVNVARGATTGDTATITVTPVSGFTGTVSLSCAITPTATNDPATCSLSPASVTIGVAAHTSTLTVNTRAATTSLNRTNKLFWLSAGGAARALVLFLGIPVRRRS